MDDNRNDELNTDIIDIVNRHHDEVVAREREQRQQMYVARKPANLRNEPKYNNIRAKNINVRRNGFKIIKRAIILGLAIVLITVSIKLMLPKNNSAENMIEVGSMVDPSENIRTLDIEQCDFSNIHVILREAKTGTIGVVNTCHDEFEALGVSNERISRDTSVVDAVRNAQEANPGKEIVVINVETGVERSDEYRTILMTDGSNDCSNTADTLVACMNTSFREYGLGPDVRSGKFNSSLGKRTETSVEASLIEADLVEGVTQFTVDLPGEVSSNTLTRNDAASAIVEGMMRWAALPEMNRHDEVYYRVGYGDTLSEIAQEYNTSVDSLKSFSDLWDVSYLGAGWTLTVNRGPETAQPTVVVDNPAVTSNPNEVTQVTYSYIVAAGDTLSEIADEYGVPMSSIHTRSGNANQIQVGETLNITKPDLILTSPKVDLTDVHNRTY